MEENYVAQEQDSKPNWKNKQRRKISKELKKWYMWLPLRVHLMPTYMISQLGSEVSGISSSKIFVGAHWGSLTGCIQPQKHLIQKYKVGQ